RSFIEKTFGKSYLPAKANEYTPKGRAQDAHEAIRATDAALTPESIKDCLTPEQFKLYDLIWRRFIASQMADAVVSRTNLLCSSGDYKLKQSGSVVSFDGWGKLYPLGIKDITMSPAVKGEELSVEKIIKEQKFTQPPARYTDAGLVKVLEEKGIGRPSTYASIIDTLSIRGYVDHGEEDKKIIPTKLGRIVNKFLVKNFSEVINEDFTANMENELDEIESGTIYWRDVLKNFWPGFKAGIEETKAHAESMKIEPEPIGEKCPECGRDLVKRTGRFGDFIACIGYPECKYTRNILKTTGVKCPKCGQGEIVRRKAGKGKAAGRTFYGCSRYPDCDFITNKKPVSDEKKKEQEYIEPNESDM
ncbi:MAG: type I DNA topoisomerase, partial [Synergistes sp.]|nr:type I DNA topoisomerase [Synergistes sp.]